MLRALALLLALLAPLASAEEAQQWLPVAGKVVPLPGERMGAAWSRRLGVCGPPLSRLHRRPCRRCCCLTRTHSSASRCSPPDGVLAGVEVVLQLEGGRRLVAFPLPDGSFSFSRVPLGVHTLGVEHRTLVFPAVKLDVGTSRTGKVAAAAADVPGVSELRGSPTALCGGQRSADGRQAAVRICHLLLPMRRGCLTRLPAVAASFPPQQPALPYPLLLRPVAMMEYFEVRLARRWRWCLWRGCACAARGGGTQLLGLPLLSVAQARRDVNVHVGPARGRYRC